MGIAARDSAKNRRIFDRVRFVKAFACVLAYGLAAFVSFRFNFAKEGAVSFYLQGGVALASYLLVSRRIWPWLFFLYLVIDFSGAWIFRLHFVSYVYAGVLLALAPLSAAKMLLFCLRRRPRLERLEDLLGFLTLPLLLVYPAISLVAGWALLEIEDRPLWLIAREFWTSHLVGSLLIAPMLLAWGQQKVWWIERYQPKKMLENLGLVASLLLVILFIFSHQKADFAADLHYLVYPLWLLIAVHAGPRGAPSIALLVTLLCFGFSAADRGPFALLESEGAYEQLLLLFIFLSVGLNSSLLLSVITSERRDAQRKHRESQLLLEGLVANIPAAISIKDNQGRYLLINRCMEILLKKPAHQVLGVTDAAIMPTAEAERITQQDHAILEGGELLRFEERVEIDAKSHSLLTTKFPLFPSSGGPPVLCGVATDITHLKEMESERLGILEREKAARIEAEGLFQEAQRLNRLKDEFLMTLSHELRIPLHGILGWTQIICDQQTDREQRELAFVNLRQSVEAESRVIDELLDISRILTRKVSMNVEWVDLEGVARASLRAVEAAAAKKNLQLDLSRDTNPHGVNGDSRRLEQILINLLLNAIKFTPEYGRVTIELKTQGREVMIVVQDSGVGISGEHLPHIFKRFWQADSSLSRQFGGLGIGLALVQELVALHGGSIRADSPGLGQGATFTLTLPLSETPRVLHDLPSKAEENAREIDLHTLRLLAVDDDEATCKLLSILFAGEFKEVKTATSAEAAMKILGHWRPDFILCDIAMPGEDGISFIKRARALALASDWSIHTAALSANADESNIRTALQEGFEAFLTKPIDPPEIIRVVKHLCSRQRRWPHHSYPGSLPYQQTQAKSFRV